jgi:large conductance mechanosensitive channel
VFKGFKEFIARGNVVELAVAVVMGAAFSAIVNALVADIITPLITAIFGKPDYSNLFITLHHSQIKYGSFLNAVIAFLLVAIGVYFFIVMPINKLNERSRIRRGLPAKPDASTTPTEIELLTEIRNALVADNGGGNGAGGPAAGGPATGGPTAPTAPGGGRGYGGGGSIQP